MKRMKLKNKGKITLSFASPDFFFKISCYEVFAKQKKENPLFFYYLGVPCTEHLHL